MRFSFLQCLAGTRVARLAAGLLIVACLICGRPASANFAMAAGEMSWHPVTFSNHQASFLSQARMAEVGPSGAPKLLL